MLANSFSPEKSVSVFIPSAEHWPTVVNTSSRFVWVQDSRPYFGFKSLISYWGISSLHAAPACGLLRVNSFFCCSLTLVWLFCGSTLRPHS